MDIKTQIVSYANSIGLDLIGFTQCRKFSELYEFYRERKDNGLENEFEETDIEIRINPNHYMSEGKTIISIAFPYLHSMGNNGFSLYTQGLDYHYVVKEYLNKICLFIEGLGGTALSFVDSNTLPERYIAYLSGIGFIGKNNMLITEKYGSFVFLGEIITDLEIKCEGNNNFNKVKNFTKCGKCRLCFESCPTKAISEYRRNCNICMSYITQKKDIEDKFFNLMEGRIFGCDSCQLCCPYNKEVHYSSIEYFKQMKFMENLTTEEIINMDNQRFKDTFKKTSCGWRGKNILIRNALIRNAIYENVEIEKYKFQSPVLKEYQNRLLQIYKV